MNPLNENRVEKILRQMPQFERDKKAERIFFEKLHRMAGIEPTHGWFEWPRLAFAGSLAALFIFVSGTVWAYQSSVTLGHFLYPWKKAAERIEIAFASTPLQKVDAHLRFSDRRLDEARFLIQQNPSLAWLFQTAKAHGDEIHLDTKEEIFLADTLADMRREVSLASEIVETAMSAVEDVQKALVKIEAATDRHIEKLEQLEKQTSKNTQAIVKKIAREEDDHLSSVLDAKDEVDEARGKKLERVQIKLLKREMKREKRHEQAKEELQKTLELFRSLPQKEQKDLSEKMDRAKEAFESGKFGRVKGLSKALENRMENMERKMEKERQAEEPAEEPAKEKEKKVNIYNDPKLSPPKPETIQKRADESSFLELKNVKGAERIENDDRTKERIKKIPLIDPNDIQDFKDIEDFDKEQDIETNEDKKDKEIRLADPEDVMELDDMVSESPARLRKKIKP